MIYLVLQSTKSRQGCNSWTCPNIYQTLSCCFHYCPPLLIEMHNNKQFVWNNLLLLKGEKGPWGCGRGKMAFQIGPTIAFHWQWSHQFFYFFYFPAFLLGGPRRYDEANDHGGDFCFPSEKKRKQLDIVLML